MFSSYEDSACPPTGCFPPLTQCMMECSSDPTVLDRISNLEKGQMDFVKASYQEYETEKQLQCFSDADKQT